MSKTMETAKNLSLQEKRALVAELLRKKTSKQKCYPASFGQQRLWFIDQIESATAAFNVPTAFRLKGTLDLAALQRSIDEVVRRHDVLRTTFANVDGQPMQRINPPQPLELRVESLTFLPERERHRAALDIVNEEARRPFGLAEGPLLRVRLLRLSDDEHMAVATMHHIITDAWSVSIFIQEIATLYEAYRRGEPSPLDELPIQYADYAIWQRDWLQGETLKAELSYWRAQLGHNPPAFDLPSDFPRPPAQDYTGGIHTAVLNSTITEGLNALSRRAGATLFMTLLAAFKALLYRYTLREDITVGTAISGRARPELEKLIGFFINTLVVRTDLSGNPIFEELLGRVKDVALGAFAHQDIPFERLVEELQPARSLGRNPLFDVMFNFGNTPRKDVSLGGLSISVVEMSDPQAKFPITLYADEVGAEIVLSVVYQKALFSHERMESLLSQYTHLLGQIVAAPDRPILSYSLRSPETSHLLPDPEAVLSEPRYEFVTDRFSRWATQSPGQVAVTQQGREWTYGELGDRAAELSHALVEQGLEPGGVVAIVGPRSFALIVSIIATLQARGVLLVVDRNLPENHKKHMLVEARARHVLYIGNGHQREEWLSEGSPTAVIELEPDSGTISNRPLPSRRIEGFNLAYDDPAYIVFTSGTTGVPKGIRCSQKGLSHFIAWEGEEFAVVPDDRCAQLSGLSFEVSMRDVFLPLTNGATLCLPPDQSGFDASAVLAWVERERVSVLHIVPSVAQAVLLNRGQGIKLTALRLVLFAGEPLTNSLVAQWREAFPGPRELVNLYGPTETTLAKCFYRVPDVAPVGIQPVGHCLPHAQALVLNREGGCCGINEPGEIVIRTPFRSQGYVNADEGRATHFVPNPFRDDPGDVVYFTGDRGRFRADGVLEILGRLDHQVKVRGVRVELEEVQAVLCQHPDVGECVAAVRQDAPDDQRLVAYVVPKPGSAARVSQLRSHLKRELPRYNVPSNIILLDRLPLTSNGKVDRAALPPPDQTRPELEAGYAPPRDAVELRLAQIWEETLKVSPVGVKDDFFDLGGHSFLAVRLMTQIQKAFGRSLPLRVLFDGASIERLAALLRQQDVRPGTSLVAIQPSGNKAPLFFVHPAGGNVLCYMELAKRLGPDQPFYGLQACGGEGEAEPLTRIEDMASRYINAVREVQAEGPYRLGGWSMGAVVAYEMAQQLTRQGEPVGLLVVLDHRPPGPSGDGEPLDDVGLLARIFGDAVPIDTEMLARLDEDQRVQHCLQQAASLNLIPPEVGAAQARNYLKLYRANLKALRDYVARKYPGRITLLKTSYEVADSDETIGWGAFAEQGVEVYEVPGSHHDMVAPPHVEALARCLSECLARANGRERAMLPAPA